MHRFFGIVRGKEATLEGEEFKHLKVRRIEIGETVEVLDERTLKPYLCKLVKLERKRAVLEVLEELPLRVPRVRITLYQCVPVKLSTFDEIVEKLSEVGVSKLIPVVSERSFQKLSVLEEKRERWERIARQAAKQCGRHVLLEISPPVKLEDIKPIPEGLNLFPFERESPPICRVLEKENAAFGGVSLVVGAEGGFSRREAELLKEKGFTPVSLGNFILRSETAAVVAAAVVYNALIKR